MNRFTIKLNVDRTLVNRAVQQQDFRDLWEDVIYQFYDRESGNSGHFYNQILECLEQQDEDLDITENHRYYEFIADSIVTAFSINGSHIVFLDQCDNYSATSFHKVGFGCPGNVVQSNHATLVLQHLGNIKIEAKFSNPNAFKVNYDAKE